MIVIGKYYRSIPLSGLGSLYQRANAFCAQHFADLSPTFINCYSLQVGAESPRGCLLGPRAVLTEGRLFATV